MLKAFTYISTKYKVFAAFTAILTFFQVVTDLIVPGMLGSLVNVIEPHNNKYELFFISREWTIEFDSANQLLLVCSLLMIGFSLLGILFGMVSVWLASKIAVEVARVTRNNLFQKIQTLSASNISKFGTSSLITRLTNDVTQVQTNIIIMLRLMIRAPFLFVGGLIFSIITSLKLSISLAVMIPIMIVVIVITSIFVMPLFRKNQKIIDSINNESRENILGARVVKSFNLEDAQKNKFFKINNEWQVVSTKAFTIMNILLPIIMFITNMGMVVIVLIGKFMFESDLDKLKLLPEITTFSQYLGYVTSGLIMTVMVMVLVIRSRISWIRITDVLKDTPDIKKIVSDVKIETPSIEFNNVCFKYNKDSSEDVLSNITFSLRHGQTLGIIGPTGSGKSTLINLISRVYEPQSGSIKIDSKELNTIDSINLNESVSQVLQESVLYSGTIKSNLLFGNLNASDEEIEWAIDIACAKQFIEKFDNKLDHVVEQRGKNLSGGQKQRLQIARGIISKPKILILDDSTSALDALTDRTLRQNIKKHLKQTTTIIVAQKINSIKDADKIIVLDKGKIIGYGNHGQLMKTCYMYKEIADSQLSMEEE